MSRNLGGLATFARTAPVFNFYLHAVPNKSGINKGLSSLCDGCPSPGRLVKTCFWNLAAMYGLACPVDTSHHIKLLSNDLSSWKSNVEDIEWRNRVNSVSRAWKVKIILTFLMQIRES